MADGEIISANSNMLIFLATLVVKTTFIIGVCWACTALLKRYTASLRHAVWMVSMLGVLLLPALNLALPDWQFLQFHVSRSTGNIAATSPIVDTKVMKLAPSVAPAQTEQPTAVKHRELPSEAMLEDAANPFGYFSLAHIILLVWALGAGGVVGRMLLDHWRLRRMKSALVHVQSGDLNAIIEQIRDDLSIRRPVALHVGPHTATPMTWGLFNPVVVLPTDALTWRADKITSVLYHELSHVRRFDYLWNLICQLACALYWFNPLAWMASRAAQFEREKASDEQVLRSGIGSDTYAEHLLFVARSSRRVRKAWGSIAMARQHALQQRIHAILSVGVNQRLMPAGYLWTFATIGGSLLSLMAAAQIEFIEPSPTFIWLEAESGQLHGDIKGAVDSEASNGRYIESQKNGSEGAGNNSGNNAGMARFRFDVSEPGNYIIWGRVQAPSGSSNSFYVAVDDSLPTVWDIYGPDSENRAHHWTWDRVRTRGTEDYGIQAPVSYNTYTLEPGRHTLTIKAREKGTRIDHILITNDLAYRPRGMGNAPAGTEPDYIWIEAEHGTWRTPIDVESDDAASNGRYLWATEEPSSQGSEEGLVRFRFEVNHTDDYAVWGRVIAPSSSNNSFFIAMDGAGFEIWDIDAPDKKQASLPWSWEQVHVRESRNAAGQNPTMYPLERGVHSLALKNREAGTRIDRLLITNDKSFRPEGWGTSPRDLVPSYFWVEAEDGMLTRPLMAEVDPTASGGRYIAVRDEVDSRRNSPGDGRAVYAIDIPLAGTYLLWSRVRARNNEGDSFWVRMDEGPWIRWNGIVHGDAWHWEEVHDAAQQEDPGVVSFELNPGRHVLEIAYREPGSKLDGFLITNDLNFAPASYSDDPIVLKQEHLISASRSTH